MNVLLFGIAIVYGVAGLVYLGTRIGRRRRPFKQSIQMTEKRSAELNDVQAREQERR